jgi:ribosomal protein S15P/S13E
MQKVQKFSLIRNEFNADEAKEVLLSLYTAKIQFNKLKNLSSHIRFNQSDTELLGRIEELEDNRDKLLNFLSYAQENKIKLHVQSEIRLEIIE